MTRNVQDFWDWVETLAGERVDYSVPFLARENARYNLVDGMGTPHQPVRQTHLDISQVGGTRGCFQRNLHIAGARRYDDGANPVPNKTADSEAAIFYAYQGFDAAKYAVRFFGERLSIARESNIRDMLVAGVDTRFVENDSRFAEWLDEFDNCSHTPRFGTWMVSFDEDVPLTREAGVSTAFDADQTLHLRPPARFADEISNSRIVHELDIANGFKATVVGIRPDGTRETVTDRPTLHG